jgi:hypothetical protein
VSALPLELKAALVVVMVAAIAWSCFGQPPEARDDRNAIMWSLTAVLLGVTAAVRLVTGEPDGGAFLAGTVVALSLAIWHVRGPAEDEDGGLGVPAPSVPPGGGPRPGPLGVDWDAFDRARRGWDRPRANA